MKNLVAAAALRRSMTAAIIAGTAALTICVALTACSWSGRGDAVNTSTNGPRASAGSGGQMVVSRTLTGRAYDLVYDPYRDAIWYVVMGPSAPPEPGLSPSPAPTGGSTTTQLDAQLFEASASTGLVTKEFTIPNPDGDTGMGDVVGIAPDQSVWVAESYGLYRVDPSTSAVQSTVLPRDVSGAVNTPLQGTSVTAMTFTSDSALIGRNNVPVLQQWSLNLQPMADLPLPAGDYGPSYLTTTSSGIQMLTYSTSDPTSVTGQQASIPLPKGAQAPAGPNGVPLDPQYVTVRPDHVTANLQGIDGSKILTVTGSAPQTLTWQPTTGSAIQIAWQETTGQITNPLGKQVPTRSWPQLEASVVLPNDTLWIIVMTSSATQTGPALQRYTAS
jgi:hypothetical protein